MNDIEDNRSFAEKIMAPPLEEAVYQSYVKKEFWSFDEFVALSSELTPENYKNGTKGSTLITDAIFEKRSAFATKIFSIFLEHLEKNRGMEKDFHHAGQNIYMSSWKFIKWMAQNYIRMKSRFFDALPITLKELYFEFQPINTDLRTAHKGSLSYHRAYYLDCAEQLLKESPHFTPSEVYRHPRMQNTKHYIAELGGKYTKRTILESWLPRISDLPKGSPKKHS